MRQTAQIAVNGLPRPLLRTLRGPRRLSASIAAEPMAADLAQHKSLLWYRDSHQGLTLTAFLDRHPCPVLLFNPADPSAPKPSWKTNVMVIPDAATLRSGSSFPRRFDLRNTWVMRVEKSARNPYQDRVYLGRAPSNDVILEEASISKSHAFFAQDKQGRGGGWNLTDVGSRNGTTVGGQPLDAHAALALPGQSAILFGLSALAYYCDPAAFWALLQSHA